MLFFIEIFSDSDDLCLKRFRCNAFISFFLVYFLFVSCWKLLYVLFSRVTDRLASAINFDVRAIFQYRTTNVEIPNFSRPPPPLPLSISNSIKIEGKNTGPLSVFFCNINIHRLLFGRAQIRCGKLPQAYSLCIQSTERTVYIKRYF